MALPLSVGRHNIPNYNRERANFRWELSATEVQNRTTAAVSEAVARGI